MKKTSKQVLDVITLIVSKLVTIIIYTGIAVYGLYLVLASLAY